MMGTSHATSGALGWLLIAPPLAMATGTPLSTPILVAGTVATAGAALLPDLDHPKSTIAYTLGPVTYGLAKLTNLVFGGHRQGTHTLLFAIGAGVVTFFASRASDIVMIAIMFAMSALAIRSLGLVPPRTSQNIKGLVVAAEAAAITWLLWQYEPGDWSLWLGVSVFLGCVLHCVGDTCTPEGVPWFKPISKKRFAVPIIDRTGNFLEVGIITPIMTIAVFFLIYKQFWDDISPNLPWT
jgi:membrane-bound metal-dependent hydrolase YbcI (DUF457 family)